jgi:hypothetical protein
VTITNRTETAFLRVFAIMPVNMAPKAIPRQCPNLS